jgi:hypothetical protein
LPKKLKKEVDTTLYSHVKREFLSQDSRVKIKKSRETKESVDAFLGLQLKNDVPHSNPIHIITHP